MDVGVEASLRRRVCGLCAYNVHAYETHAWARFHSQQIQASRGAVHKRLFEPETAETQQMRDTLMRPWLTSSSCPTGAKLSHAGNQGEGWTVARR